MPEDRILRALQHVYDELEQMADEKNFAYISSKPIKELEESGVTWKEDQMNQLWKRKDLTMPLIAKHLAVEGREHHFEVPRNIFQIYLDTPIEKIKVRPSGTSQS